MRRSGCHRVTAAVLMLALAVAVPRAGAGATAEELIKEGVALRRKGDDLGALQRFEQAYEMDKTARALAQMGLAEQALGRWVASFEHLTQALDSKSDFWIQKNRKTITDALDAVGEHVGRLEIMGGSPNAELRIDGTVRGTLPLAAPLAVATGSITIELSATGFFPRQRTTIVRARQTTRESFDPLVAVPTAVAAAPAAPPAGGGEGGAPSAEPTPVAPATPSGSADTGTGEPSALRASAKWIAWGLGAAAVGLGVFGYLGQNSAADDFNRDCAIDGNGNVVANMGVNPATCRDRQSSVDSNFRLEVIGFAGAAVLAGAGVTLWLTEPKPAASGTSALSCVPSVTPGGGAWMGCRLRF